LELAGMSGEEQAPAVEDPVRPGDQGRRVAERGFTLAVELRVPGQLAVQPRAGEQLEGVEDVDREVAERPAARRRRTRDERPRQVGQLERPRLENRDRVPGQGAGVPDRVVSEPEQRAQLRDVQEG
jgi:hypothetical protein